MVGAASVTPPTIDDIAVELKRRDDKHLNFIMFCLSPKAGTDDRDLFLDLIDHELNVHRLSPKYRAWVKALLINLLLFLFLFSL